jgi:geranylgeranylglycerol-phosphate geranylgeranyltransferase
VQPLRAIFQIIRLDSSLVAFLSVSVPIFTRTNSLEEGIKHGSPLLFISMCTYIINDMADIEKDRTNHPDRPLARGQLNPALAAGLYFFCLGLALFSIRYCIAAGMIAFWYYLLLTAVISYNYVVEFLPALKATYVAAATSIPIQIVIANYPTESDLYLVAGGVFFFTLGKELCMDICDRPGDLPSFMHTLNPNRVASVAACSMICGLTLLLPQVKDACGGLVLLLMTFLLMISMNLWANRRPRTAIDLAKVNILLGVYFLA